MKKLICTVLLFTALCTITACGISLGEPNGIKGSVRSENKGQSSNREPEISTDFPDQPDAESEEFPSGDTSIPSGARVSSDKYEEIKESGTETGAVLNNETQTEIPSVETAQEKTQREETEMKMKIQVGDTTFTATLAENSSVDALKELMEDGSLILNMSDYANMEKGADLGVTLPQNNEQMNTQAGDIILYQGRTFVIYYDTNSWSLTPIAKIDNVDAEELREALGTGDVTVTISLE